MLYQRVYEQTAAGQRCILELDSDPEVDEAFDLITWAFSDWIAEQDTPWPARLPQPTERDGDFATASTTTKLFVQALGYVLHHELAHDRLRHSSSYYEAEQEADGEAARWMLDGLAQDDGRFILRAHGIAVGLGALCGAQIHRRSFTSDTHPRSFDRLVHVLDACIEYAHHPAWRMAAAVLRMHLSASTIDVPPGTFPNARACVFDYAERIAEWAERHGA